MKVNPKVPSSKNLGLCLQEVLMRNHVVMRKEIDPPMDHKSDQELDKGRQTQVIVRQDNDGIRIISINKDKSLNSEHDTEITQGRF